MLLDSLFHNETINTVFSFDTYKGFEMGEKKCEKKNWHYVNQVTEI